ncbi:MAG: C-5 cytosine-specific DNA methylase [Streptosporangiales bacterium]|nr:C-5 cytosine-specific DNA methylase [Streptosporangiales bacterium]
MTPTPVSRAGASSWKERRYGGRDHVLHGLPRQEDRRLHRPEVLALQRHRPRPRTVRRRGVGVSVLEGFAGPGGFSEGARIVGLPAGVGIETNADACATAQAAGHRRVRADIRTLKPRLWFDVTGWVSGPPCPTYSGAGRRSGLDDYGTVLAAAERDDHDAYTRVTDPRSALVLETLRLALELPGVEWIVAEQVPAVHAIWEEFAAELAIDYWSSCDVITLRADDFGMPTRRTRVFLIAHRFDPPDLSGLPVRTWWSCGRNRPPTYIAPPVAARIPAPSMAGALGWPDGVRINTRGQRRTAGGNEFAADAPAPSITGRARSWYRTDTGQRLQPWQAGLLQGFPPGYPWHGSRSSRFQQAADAVPPPMAAAVLATVTGRRWRTAITAHLHDLYGPAPGQLDLFEGVA